MAFTDCLPPAQQCRAQCEGRTGSLHQFDEHDEARCPSSDDKKRPFPALDWQPCRSLISRTPILRSRASTFQCVVDSRPESTHLSQEPVPTRRRYRRPLGSLAAIESASRASFAQVVCSVTSGREPGHRADVPVAKFWSQSERRTASPPLTSPQRPEVGSRAVPQVGQSRC